MATSQELLTSMMEMVDFELQNITTKTRHKPAIRDGVVLIYPETNSIKIWLPSMPCKIFPGQAWQGSVPFKATVSEAATLYNQFSEVFPTMKLQLVIN